MKTKAGKILRWVTAIAGLLLMGVIAFTAVQTVRRYVLVEGELYPRQAQLDLRDSELTERTYEKLQRKLPDSTILWSVPFQGKLLSNDVEEIAVTDLTERDSELLKYFEQLPDYRERLALARQARQIGKSDIAHSRRLEERIAKEGLAVSPTSLDTLTGCRFRYFCKYVLKLKPVERAEMSNKEVGPFVHDMMEKVLGSYARDNHTPIWEEDRAEVYRQVDERMKQYLQGYFGGGERSPRFRYLFARTREAVHELIDRLCDEFAQSAFRAEDFE